MWTEKCAACENPITITWIKAPCPHDECVPNAHVCTALLDQHSEEFECADPVEETRL